MYMEIKEKTSMFSSNPSAFPDPSVQALPYPGSPPLAPRLRQSPVPRAAHQGRCGTGRRDGPLQYSISIADFLSLVSHFVRFFQNSSKKPQLRSGFWQIASLPPENPGNLAASALHGALFVV